jgi:hypothetical protein
MLVFAQTADLCDPNASKITPDAGEPRWIVLINEPDGSTGFVEEELALVRVREEASDFDAKAAPATGQRKPKTDKRLVQLPPKGPTL